MKKVIILIAIFLVFSSSVLAEAFEVSVLNYDAKTGNARIKVSNVASSDFYDVNMKIDDITEVHLADFFRSGISFSTFINLYPGQHKFTLTTREGITETKTLYFSPTEEQVRGELEKRIAGEVEERRPRVIMPQEEVSVKEYIEYVYVLVALIGAIIIIYFIYKRFRSKV